MNNQNKTRIKSCKIELVNSKRTRLKLKVMLILCNINE